MHTKTQKDNKRIVKGILCFVFALHGEPESSFTEPQLLMKSAYKAGGKKNLCQDSDKKLLMKRIKIFHGITLGLISLLCVLCGAALIYLRHVAI